MLNLRQNATTRWGGVAAFAIMALLVTSTAVFAQATGTSTIRGTVEDSSGGVLPGATVTITNVGTKAVAQRSRTNVAATWLVIFPGTYDLKVELEGFKTYEQKAINISPSDTRGIDVKLEVGTQSETITVTAQTEVIQTETGAREGVLTAAADRQPVDHRPQLARAAAHPARCRRSGRRRRLKASASVAAPTTRRATRSTASAGRTTPSASTART